MADHYSAKEAAALLGISIDTLYAYVSRGLLHSQEVPGQRSRRYARSEIERLLHKKQARKAPEATVLKALDWGMPVLQTQISSIANGQLFYHHLPLAECLELSLDQLVGLLWQLPPAELQWPSLSGFTPHLAPDIGFFEALRAALLTWEQADIAALNLSPAGVQRTCLGLLWQLFKLAAHCLSPGSEQPPAPESQNLQALLQAALPEPRQLALFQLALTVTADHELNVSTFSARCVASAQASPYACLSAALAALSGRRHGGQTLLVQQLFQHCQQATGIAAGLRSWLQQHQTLPGFGHPLYPQGDPRWQLCWQHLSQHWQDHPQLPLITALAEQGSAAAQAAPTLDFVLVSAAYLLPLKLTALDLFALGRSIGWLAHIQEQYQQPGLIRPRAKHQGD